MTTELDIYRLASEFAAAGVRPSVPMVSEAKFRALTRWALRRSWSRALGWR